MQRFVKGFIIMPTLQMRKWRPQRDYFMLTILWINGETEADLDTPGEGRG